MLLARQALSLKTVETAGRGVYVCGVIAGGFPRRFGSYVLLKPLARGGMGELDLAATGARGMEKLCVIKRVLPHLLVADNVQRFREEATMMMRLSHGNLVGVLDAGRAEGQLYLTMDFVEGKDLLATWNQCATRQVAFPVEIAAYVTKELARGLGYAHAYRDLRLVHRDISPANVLLSYSGEVKLTDFGLAISKLKEQQTAPGIIYGKLAYLAPEQARGQPLDGRTDLYAAGILLWEMLTGRQLFPSHPHGATSPPPGQPNSALDALEKVRHPVVLSPSSVTDRVPPDLDAIVMRALAVDPDGRYQTAEELRTDLASFLARHAPATDAATLASFMAILFQDQIDQERAARDDLLARASSLLPGPKDKRKGNEGLILAGGRGAPALELEAELEPDNEGRPGDPSPAEPATSGLPSVATPESVVASVGAVHLGSPVAVAPPHHLQRAAPELGATGLQRRRQGHDRRGRHPDSRTEEGQRGSGFSLGMGHEGDGTPLPSPARDPASAETGDDRRVGTTIGGRYLVRRLCGEGAMGRVYEGHHVEIGRRVAIKVLHSTFLNTPDVVERFRREARAASRIGHPNIVDVTDSGTTADGAFFFVMEYLDGVDLENLIARGGPLEIGRALLIAAQVCRALVAAHAAGVIHRDLKPANVMLVRNRDEEDLVKVLDFGISKQSQLDEDSRGRNVGLTHPDAAVGTPIYMAPEQIAGQPADGRTDVYAVGELLFEMLTGAPPYGGSDIIAVFNSKANQDPAPVRSLRPEVPASIELLLRRAMARVPADRQASMAELKDQLMNALATRMGDTPTPPGSPRPTAQHGPDRRLAPAWWPARRAVWLTGLGAVAGLGIASLIVLRGTDLGQSSPSRATARSPSISAGAALATPGAASLEMVPPRATNPATVIMATSPRVQAPRARTTSEPGGNPPRVSPTRDTAGTRGSFHPRDASHRAAVPPSSRAIPPQAASDRAASSAARMAPSDGLARGRMAFAKGNFPEAVRLGRAILAAGAEGNAVGAHLLLGDAFYKMERFGDALSEYDAVLSLSPAHAQARRGHDLALRRSRP